ARTTHGSTTSRPVFAGIYVALARQGQQVFEKQAYDFLTEAIGSDYYDIQGGTTAEGVHMGVMGETLAVIQNDYAGVDMLHDTFRVMPKLPSQWSSISFTQKYHGVTINLQISHHHVIAKADKKISVIIAGEQMILQPDERKEVKYHG
ncbi:glycoside hydrolase family 65 protein, partial [Pseudomonas stutzeri]|nr:glycoside hydrolase family 65 protein [Stutzerimonas stutzeri]